MIIEMGRASDGATITSRQLPAAHLERMSGILDCWNVMDGLARDAFSAVHLKALEGIVAA